MKNVIAAIFDVESEGYHAIAKLRQIPDTGSYTILQMALIKKENGGVKVCEIFDSGVDTSDDTVLGGVLGGLVGILGGPLGVLLMSSYGMAAGNLMDLGDAADGLSLIETVADKLGDDTVALVIYADERNESVIDAHLTDFKVEIRRYDAAAIDQEVEDAITMQEEMARQARLNFHKEVKDNIKQKHEEKVDKIKAAIEKHD